MLKMRLQRVGRKNRPSFRVVITDSRNAQVRGRHADTIGNYDPLLGRFEIDAEKAKKWISQGVQPSDTIYNFLVEKKIIEGRKKNVLPKKAPVINEAKVKAEAEAKAKEEAVVAAKAKEEAEASAKAAEVAEAPLEEAPAPEVAEATPETTETPTEEVKA